MQLAALVLVLGAAGSPYKADPGPHAVTVQDVSWKDAARADREVPARLYLPDAAACPCPAIVFSPGLGGSREHYVYLGKHWASHGYVVAVVTHRGSDTAALRKAWKEDGHWGPARRVKGALATVLADEEARKARPKDVSFALDRLIALEDRTVDAARAGIGGHSYGAWTTMVTMGAKTASDDFRDARFLAGIAMSPQGSSGWAKFDAESWSGLTSPMLYMTGTKDDFGGQTPKSRRGAFDGQTAKDQYFLMIDGAAHFAFSDNESLLVRGERDKRHHGWILQESTAFWDAYLRGDAAAKAWLEAETLESVTGNAAKIDRR
jgi:predicted dienelactone hydrolase